MLYHWLYPLSHQFQLLNVFKYISTRSFIAFILSMIISIVWGKRFIALMKVKQFGQSIREDGPQTHLKKKGTPTFGGVFILGSAFIGCLICGNFLSLPFMLALLVTISFFFLGGIDDYLKVLKKNSKGVSARQKLAWQFATGLLAGYLMVKFNVIDTKLYVPFLKEPILDIGWLYVPFAAFVIVGSSNALNLTDGLDGLAIGPTIISAATLGSLAYLSGHVELANYLFIPYIPDVGELMVLVSAIVGAGVGFLWYNTYPAEIFMGDVGSLSLGGSLGTIAVLTKNEFLFVLIGGVFVIEALSVILQVGSFKLRGGKRIFKMAPLHHHFELSGWAETKVIVRFWIISLLFAILALATLKLR
ncbi:MAG TPA: phospho-N-acetylmuramoyl-pentapeptide-transferase [Bacteriovoracaceae bacterium]|nr:phospho-N-acetylmuramoyl-pentapeptide-transferase [Bacteriovoracaceae bacterium]